LTSTSAATWQTASLFMSLKPSESAAMWHTTSVDKWHPCQQPGGIRSASRWHPRRHPGGIHVSSHVASTSASKSAAMSHQSIAIRDDFILSRIVSHGLGCMGLGLASGCSVTIQIRHGSRRLLRERREI
jgi:hypothetical protein